jgi:hypothetical protein
MENLSPQAQQALAVEFTKRDKGSLWTDKKWRKAKLIAAQSLLGTAAGMGIGSVLTRGLGAMGMTTAATTAAGATAQVPSRVAGAIGYGLGEASVAAPSVGAGVEEEIMAMSHEMLMENAADYRAIYASLENKDPTVRAERAKQLLAKAAAGDASALALVSTFLLSAPLGALVGGFTGKLPLATTRTRSIAVGAGGEATQEFLQSGAEKIAENIGMRGGSMFDPFATGGADPTRALTAGALEEAVGGALAGGMMGAVPGTFTPLQAEPGLPDAESPLGALAQAEQVEGAPAEGVLEEKDELDAQIDAYLDELNLDRAGAELQDQIEKDLAFLEEDRRAVEEGIKREEIEEMEVTREVAAEREARQVEREREAGFKEIERRRGEEEIELGRAREEIEEGRLAGRVEPEATAVPTREPQTREQLHAVGAQPAEGEIVAGEPVPTAGRPGTSLGEALREAGVQEPKGPISGTPEPTPTEPTPPPTTKRLEPIPGRDETSFRYLGDKFDINMGRRSGRTDISVTVAVKDSSSETGYRVRDDISKDFDTLEEAKAYAEKIAAKDTVTAPTEPTPEGEPGVGYADERMRDEVNRANLQRMADELVPGGGITLIPETEGGRIAPEDATAFTGRTPSVNPQWFQNMNAQGEKASVRYVQDAVTKALEGRRLGEQTESDMEVQAAARSAEAELDRIEAEGYATEDEWTALQSDLINADKPAALQQRYEALRDKVKRKADVSEIEEGRPADENDWRAIGEQDGSAGIAGDSLTEAPPISRAKEQEYWEGVIEGAERIGNTQTVVAARRARGQLNKPIEGTATEIVETKAIEDKSRLPYGEYEASAVLDEQNEGISDKELLIRADETLSMALPRTKGKDNAQATADSIQSKLELLSGENTLKRAEQKRYEEVVKRFEKETRRKIGGGTVAPSDFVIDETKFNEVGPDTEERVFRSTVPKDRVALDTKLKREGDKYISPEEADKIVTEWEDHAIAQRDHEGKSGPQNHKDNFNRIILSLFDTTGTWANPYALAGYDVRVIDIKNGVDVQDFSAQYLEELFDSFGGKEVYGILAACPCTTFSGSGARWHKDRHDNTDPVESRKIIEELWGTKAAEAKNDDGSWMYASANDYGNELVAQTMRTLEYYRPKFWALENPVGRIESSAKLPGKWRTGFQPHNMGDPYTKRTLLWGEFNEDLPTANVEPTEGSKMHLMPPGEGRAEARAETPVGFSYAFFMANNYLDTSPLERTKADYWYVAGAIEEAFRAGVTEEQIRKEIYLEEAYEPDESTIEGAKEQLRELINKGGPGSPMERQQPHKKKPLGETGLEGLEELESEAELRRGEGTARGMATEQLERRVAETDRRIAESQQELALTEQRKGKRRKETEAEREAREEREAIQGEPDLSIVDAAKETVNAPNQSWVKEVLGPEKVKRAPRVMEVDRHAMTQRGVAKVNRMIPGAEVKVLRNWKQTPSGLQQFMNAKDHSTIRAVHHMGKIFVFSDNVFSEKDAAQAALHEATHKGLRVAFGDQLDPLLDDLYANIPKKHQAAFDKITSTYEFDLGEVTQQRKATEELLAHIAEKDPQAGIIKRAIAVIRKALRKYGLVEGWSDNDIVNLIREAQGALGRKSTLDEIVFSEDVMVEETGEVFTVEENAAELLDRQDKRIGVVEKLKNCL